MRRVEAHPTAAAEAVPDAGRRRGGRSGAAGAGGAAGAAAHARRTSDAGRRHRRDARRSRAAAPGASRRSRARDRRRRSRSAGGAPRAASRSSARDRAATTIALPLYALAERAQLEPLAFDLFLLALAPEVDEGFARVFASVSGQQARARSGDGGAHPHARGAGRRVAEACAFARRGAARPRPRRARRRRRRRATATHDDHGAAVGGGARARPRRARAALRALSVERAEALPRDRTFLPDELWPHLARARRRRHGAAARRGAGRRAASGSRCARSPPKQSGALVELDLSAAPPFDARAGHVAAARLAWLADALDPRRAAAAGRRPPTRGRARRAPGRRASAICWRAFPGACSSSRDTNEPTHLELGVATTRRLSPVQVPAPDRDDARAAVARSPRRAVGGDVDFALLARTYPVTGGVISRIAGEARTLARARGAPTVGAGRRHGRRRRHLPPDPVDASAAA